MNNSTIYFNESTNFTETNVLFTSGIISFSTTVKVAMAVLVALVSFVGNTIVIFVVYTTKKLQTSIYFLVVNMSISDLLYTAIAIQPFIGAGILGCPFPFRGNWGAFICKFVNSMAFGMIASSVLTLAAISYDRFFAIVFPLKNLKSQTYLKWTIVSIWFCSALVMSPMLYSMRLHEDANISYCYEDWSPYFDTESASQTYTVALFIVIYLIPFITMLIFYSLISYFLWFRKIPGICDEISKQRIMSGRRKVVRMLITIVLCFILCWLPLQISTFSVYFSDTGLPSDFFLASEFLIRANGAINPMIYVIFNESFRRGFQRVLCCKTLSKDPINVPSKTNFLSLTSTKQSNIQTSANQKLLNIKETEV